MISISTNKQNGSRRILFNDWGGNRKTIYLGKMNLKAVELIKTRVKQLVEIQITGEPLTGDLARWVAELDSRLAEKLANVGLIESPERKKQQTLKSFLNDYLEGRIDLKESTKTIRKHVIRNLVEFFGKDRDLATVNEGDAEEFKMFLISEKLKPATIGKRLQNARWFFDAAKKRKLIASNPFASVKSNATGAHNDKRFVTVEEINQILTVCDPTWRMIVVLARYGGLRCPSEVLSLKWEQINWETERIVVDSPKTAHHPGKDCRTIPLFPELRPYLTEAFERPGNSIYVVDSQYRNAAMGEQGWRSCNLGTQFRRLIKRAGLVPWSKPFQSMRSTRETELMKQFPIHVVTAWIGNSVPVAMKHYLQVTDADYEIAVSKNDAQYDAPATQNTTQQPSATIRKDSPETTKALAKQGLMRDSALGCEKLLSQKMAGTGFEPATSRL